MDVYFAINLLVLFMTEHALMQNTTTREQTVISEAQPTQSMFASVIY